jgi:hypothetical protein
VGARIIPLLTRADLKDLEADSSLHPSLKEQARTLLGLARP